MKIVFKDIYNREHKSDIAPFVKASLLNTNSSGELESITEISRNNAAALALIIEALAKQGLITAKQIADLNNDYYTDVRFEE